MLKTYLNYERLLEDAKEHLTGKEVDSYKILKWFGEIGFLKYIHYHIVERLIFKLRQDLWDFFSK